MDYFLIQQLKHVFWVLKKNVSSRPTFQYPQHMFWLRNKKTNFQLHILIWGPAHVIREGSGKPGQLRSLTRAFTARTPKTETKIMT